MRHKLTRDERRRGGMTTAALPGGQCHLCKKMYDSHAALAGHLGLHALANKYFQGNMKSAAKIFAKIGAAASEPPTIATMNGAFADGHNALRQIRAGEEIFF